jgi:hypothetical protein
MRFGVLAEFHEPERLLDAVRALRSRGYRRMDAFTGRSARLALHSPSFSSG